MIAAFRIPALVVLSLSVAGVTSLTAFRQEVKLAYTWPAGVPLRYRITQNTVTTMSGMPGMGEMTLDQTITQVLRIVAEKVGADGTATLQQVIESVKMDMTTPMGKMGFDSADPGATQDPTGMMKDIFSAMLNEPFLVVMAPTGRIESVEGLSRVVEKISKTLPQNPGSAAALDAIKASLSDEAMRGMIGQGFVAFPDKPVKAGETWNGQLKNTNPAMGAMTTEISSTLKGIEGSGDAQIARIALKFLMKQESAATNAIGMIMKVADSSGEGELSFDVGKGRAQRSSVQMQIPMTVSGNGPDGTAVNLTTNAKSTITIELIEK
jgi:Family of unknown function (DUF6263)